MFEFVRGKRHSLDKRNAERKFSQELKPPPDVKLEHISWNVDVLRVLICQMMRRCRLDAAEVFASWMATKRSKTIVSSDQSTGRRCIAAAVR